MKTKNLFGILMLFLFTLPFLVGCEKYLKGEEKILGTATINGQNYKESIVWAWNFQGYPSCLEFYENYKLFFILLRDYLLKKEIIPPTVLTFLCFSR